MAARSRGNGTNFDWLRKSYDISTCDLSPDGNPEKYGRPMKSAIARFNLAVCVLKLKYRQFCSNQSWRMFERACDRIDKK